MDYLLSGVGLIVAVIALILAQAFTKDVATRKRITWISIIAGVVFGLAVFNLVPQLSFLNMSLSSQTLAVGGAGAGNGLTTVTTYQPTATFTAKDIFATTTVSGTAYYKTGSYSATTTAVSNTNPGTTYSYWVSNATYWVEPATKQATSSVTPFEARAWNNGTATLSIYDLVGRAVADSGKSNVSMGANKQANLEISYQGTAKSSAMPFGGVMIFEANSTISSVTCSGDDIATTNQFQTTYSVQSTSDSFKVFPIKNTIDDGSGSLRKITCQLQNGGTSAGAGSAYYVKFIQANYYVGQDGNIYLDVEKAKDGVNTRTGLSNTLSLTNYWGA